MTCLYCERPLICAACEVEFEPSTREAYEAMARREVPVVCPPPCGHILVCRWCRTAYEGLLDDESGDPSEG